MKKLLALLAVFALVLSTCIMGIGTVAFAAEETPIADFMIFDGVLEEYIGPGGEVVIPASAGITEIAANAFYQNKDITSVVIPEGVEFIGGRAFEFCDNLENVTLPYSLTQMDGNAFANCRSLQEITIPGQLEAVPIWAFSNDIGLKKVTFSYGVKEIHLQAFCSAYGLGKVIFPETIELIAGGAFNCQQDTKPVEYIICNPDCEIGLYNDTPQGNVEHQWEPNVLVTPFHSSYGVVNYKIVVPENSSVERFFNEKGAAMFANDDTDHPDTFRLVTKERSYFEELPENQKDYGITSPNKVAKPDEDKGGDTTDPSKDKDSANKTDNATDNSLATTIIIVVAVLVVLIIIAVIVVVILFATGKLGGKKEAKEKPLTEAEMREKILKEMEAEKAAAETEEEKTEE